MRDTLPASARRSQLLLRDSLGWMVLAALLYGYVLLVVAPALGRQTHGYAGYYTAARLVSDGRAGLLYDDRAFADAIRHYGIPGVYDIWDANPPTTALVLVPLAGLPTTVARPLWILTNVLLLAVAALIIAALLRVWVPPELPPGRSLEMRSGVSASGQEPRQQGWPIQERQWRDAARGLPAPLLVLAALLLYHPIAVTLALGQMYILLLALLAAAMLALASGRPTLAGLAFAGILAVKSYYGLLYLLPLLPARQWRALATAVVVWLALVLLTLPRLGLSAWEASLQSSRGLANAPTTTVTAYQTLHGLLGHLMWRDTRWNPRPWLDAPGPASLLWLACVVGLIALVLIVSWRTAAPFSARGGRGVVGEGLLLLIPISLLAAPMAEEYHYALLALPLLLLWGRAVAERWSPGWLAVLGLTTVLAAAPFPTYGRLVELPASLLYYSKLAAGLLVVCVVVCRPGAAAVWRGR